MSCSCCGSEKPTYEDPGACYKIFCPYRAVKKAQGCKTKQLCLATCCGCFYTMFCWDPTAGGPKVQQAPTAGAPVDLEMVR